MFSKPLKFFFLLTIFAVLLGACTPQQSQEITDEELATRVAKIMEEMPSPTSIIPTEELPPLATNTAAVPAEPTQAPIQPQDPTDAPATATAGVPATATVEAPTATAAPTEITPTLTPTAGLTLVPSYTPPPDDPRTKLGTPSWTDTMDSGTYWPTGSDTYTDINFADGKLNLTGNTTTDGWRLATTDSLNNFYLEMKVSTGPCTADDRYGLMFRVPVRREANKGYLFGITCDGKYSLREWDATIGENGQMTNHVYWQTNSAIQTGSNKTNTLGVMAVGDRIILYINGVLITEVKDATFTEGSFGIFVGARQTDKFTISVDEINYWNNPTP